MSSTENFRLKSGSTQERTNPAGNARELYARHSWRKAGTRSMICITTKSKSAITARSLVRCELNRRCGFYFRRLRACDCELLKKFPVNAKDAGESADKFLVLLIVELALGRQPFQMSWRIWVIRIVNEIMTGAIGWSLAV